MPKTSKKPVFAAEVVQPRTYWQRFFETSGGAALITVLLGGLMTSLINAATHKDVKPPESQVKAVEIRMAAYKEYLDQQRDIVFRASELIGRCVAASDGLIALTDSVFDPSRYADLEPQRLAMRKRFNDCATQWNDEYSRLNFAISYYHSGQPAVIGAWGEVQRATTGVMECAQQWYVAHSADPVATEGACKARKDELTKKLDDFNQQVSVSRQYAWQEWREADRTARAGPNRRPEPVGLVE